MRGPRTARRSLLPFALALGALALALYVVAYLLGGSCDPAISPYIPFGAGGLCMAVALTLGLLPGYRQRHREPYPLHWTAILTISLAASTSFVAWVATFTWLGEAPFIGC